MLEGTCTCTKSVLSNRADEADFSPRTGGSHRLVRTLATRTRGELADDGFARFGELCAVEGEILDETADDEDLHGRGVKCGIEDGASAKEIRRFFPGEG